MVHPLARRSGAVSSIVGGMRRSLDNLPGGARLNAAIDEAEDVLVDRLRERIGGALPIGIGGESDSPMARAQGLASLMVEQANTQNEEEAQQYLYLQTLSRMVPDEMRILGILSDGAAHAMIDVAGGPPVGPILKMVLKNYSYVGRSASIRLVDRTPQYIAHMRGLGLLDAGPENKELEIKYEVLAHDKTIRKLGKSIEKDYKFPPRILRRTIRASELGLALWHDCVPPEKSLRPVI